MEKYQINLNSWLIKLFIFFRKERDSYMPTDTCALRAEMLYVLGISFITLPVAILLRWMSHLKVFNAFENPPPIITLLITTLSALLTSLVGSSGNQIFTSSDFIKLLTSFDITNGYAQFIILWLVAPFLFLGIMIIIILVLLGIGLSGMKLIEKFPTKTKKPSLVKKLHKDLTDKVCTPIEYTE